MKTTSRAPWIPPERIDALVQPEPAVFLVGAVLLLWLAYALFLRNSSAERHRILRAVLTNLAVHSSVLAALAGMYFSFEADWLEHSTLARLQPYAGLAVLVQGGVVFTKAAKLMAMELLFLGHMRESVPALLINTFTGVVATAVGSWIAATVFNFQLAPLLATSAVVSLVVGLAVQDTLGNLFAGIAMQFDKPYEIGDWVEITQGGSKWLGQVYEVTWRATTLVGLADELVSLPNRVVGQGLVVNYSQRGEPVARVLVLRLPLTVDFDQVRATLLPAVASVEGVVQGPGPLLFFSDVGDAWINAKLIYWISDFGTQLRMADAVLTAAMISLREQKIEVAVPQLQVRSPAA
jgi:small-conductance mechanosensitive channel